MHVQYFFILINFTRTSKASKVLIYLFGTLNTRIKKLSTLYLSTIGENLVEMLGKMLFRFNSECQNKIKCILIIFAPFLMIWFYSRSNLYVLLLVLHVYWEIGSAFLTFFFFVFWQFFFCFSVNSIQVNIPTSNNRHRMVGCLSLFVGISKIK